MCDVCVYQYKLGQRTKAMWILACRRLLQKDILMVTACWTPLILHIWDWANKQWAPTVERYHAVGLHYIFIRYSILHRILTIHWVQFVVWSCLNLNLNPVFEVKNMSIIEISNTADHVTLPLPVDGSIKPARMWKAEPPHRSALQAKLEMRLSTWNQKWRTVRAGNVFGFFVFCDLFQYYTCIDCCWVK